MKKKIAEAPEEKEEWIKLSQESVKETNQLSDNLRQTRDSKLRMGRKRTFEAISSDEPTTSTHKRNKPNENMETIQTIVRKVMEEQSKNTATKDLTVNS